MTKKQIRFCEEYLSNGFNQGKAAVAAGYCKNGKNQNTHNASCMGAHLLKEPEIKEYIENRLSILNSKFDEVMACLTMIALGQDVDQIPLLEAGSQYLADKKIDARDRVRAISELIKFKEFQMKLQREDEDRVDKKRNDNIIIQNLIAQINKEENTTDYTLIDEEVK